MLHATASLFTSEGRIRQVLLSTVRQDSLADSINTDLMRCDNISMLSVIGNSDGILRGNLCRW